MQKNLFGRVIETIIGKPLDWFVLKYSPAFQHRESELEKLGKSNAEYGRQNQALVDKVFTAETNQGASEQAYREAEARILSLQGENKGLIAHLDETYERVDVTERRLVSIAQENEKTQLENAQLSERLDVELPKARELVSKALRISRGIANGDDVKKRRIEQIAAVNASKESYSKSLVEWQRYSEMRLRHKLKDAENAAEVIEGAAFGFAVNFAIKAYPKVPFVYYDFKTGNLYPTPAALDLLQMSGRGEEPDRMTLKSLLRYVSDEGRKVLVHSLREGEALKHYKTFTSGEESIELRLTTHPIVYKDSTKNRDVPWGVGVFLYDPRILSTQKPSVWGLIRKIDGAFEGIRKDLARAIPNLVGSRREKPQI